VIGNKDAIDFNQHRRRIGVHPRHVSVGRLSRKLMPLSNAQAEYMTFGEAGSAVAFAGLAIFPIVVAQERAIRRPQRRGTSHPARR